MYFVIFCINYILKKEQKRIEETELRARKQQLESLIKKTKTTEARIFLLENELKKNDN